MKQAITHHKKYIVPAIALSVVSIITIIGSLSALYLSDKVYRAQIGNQTLFVADSNQATETLSNLALPKEIKIEILTPTEKQSFVLETANIDASFDYEKTFKLALNNRQISDFINPQSFNPVVTYSSDKLNEFLSLIAGQLYIAPVYPDVTVNGTTVQVTRGNVGYQVNIEEIEAEIEKVLISGSNSQVAFTMSPVGQVLGDSDEQTITENNSKLIGKTLEIVYEDFRQSIYQEELLELLSNINGTEVNPMQKLINTIAQEIETDPINPVFKEENGVVVEFTPAIDGVVINNQKLKTDIDRAIIELMAGNIDSVEVDVAVNTTKPAVSIEDVNEYGIKELIGKGSSAFVGSIPNRVHNVALAAERISGTLIAPGETFSFNETVGDISVYTGFKQSYVIQGNETVLGDGGGVCQVSTTLFRAALNSGLPIAERRPHSYRVGYYEQGAPVGLDATIYSPSVDFKFTNDTNAHILIQAFIDTSKMTLEFELYGEKDGRVVTLTDPVITSVSAAPEPLYVDDPTKPEGYLQQIDWAAAGARVEYDYVVTRDGEELINKKFYSNYRPWQAKYIRGTGPAN